MLFLLNWCYILNWILVDVCAATITTTTTTTKEKNSQSKWNMSTIIVGVLNKQNWMKKSLVLQCPCYCTCFSYSTAFERLLRGSGGMIVVHKGQLIYVHITYLFFFIFFFCLQCLEQAFWQTGFQQPPLRSIVTTMGCLFCWQEPFRNIVLDTKRWEVLLLVTDDKGLILKKKKGGLKKHFLQRDHSWCSCQNFFKKKTKKKTFEFSKRTIMRNALCLSNSGRRIVLKWILMRVILPV